MKKIIATDIAYSPLGRKESVTLHYEDGTTKKIPLPIDKKDKEQVRTYTQHVIHNFNISLKQSFS